MPAFPARAVRLALNALGALSAASRAASALSFAAFAAGSLSLSACSSSYCGAPCDRPKAPEAPADRHVNQYGSLYGYLEVDSLSRPQLNIEKNSLEFLLKAHPRDAEILKAIKSEGDSAYAFRYDDYSTGGNRFDASGKLRRASSLEAGVRRVARLVGESQNRESFERYRRVRLRLIGLERAEAARDTAAAAAPPPADTAWAGLYRAGSTDAVRAPETFPSADSCARWAAGAAEALRDKAYGFEYECRQGEAVRRTRLW